MWMLHVSSCSAAAALEVIGVDGYCTGAACIVVGVGIAGPIITAPIGLGVGGWLRKETRGSFVQYPDWDADESGISDSWLGELVGL